MDHLSESLFEWGSKEDMLAGAAGCGKSTIMDVVVEESPVPVVLAAATGKAKTVLAEKTGMPTFTAHGIAYRGADEDDDGNLSFRKREGGSIGAGELDAIHSDAHRAAMQALTSGDRLLLIIDETSMLDKWLKRDLMHALKPAVQVLGVGDHEQLPPPAGRNNAGWDLRAAHAILTKVHRQNPGPLLSLVTHIRTERVVPTPQMIEGFGLEVSTDNAVQVAEQLADWHRAGEDFACLVPTNKTRVAINNLFRAAMGYPAMSKGPQKGERIIVLTNNKHVPCCNGEVGTVITANHEKTFRTLGDYGDLYIWKVRVDIGHARLRTIRICLQAWADKDLAGRPSKGMMDALWDTPLRNKKRWLGRVVGLAPAASMTVHKSQGSQYDKLIVLLDEAEWMRREESALWYTAYTRGSKTVKTVLGRKYKRRRDRDRR
jgi:hypothetical protein